MLTRAHLACPRPLSLPRLSASRPPALNLPLAHLPSPSEPRGVAPRVRLTVTMSWQLIDFDDGFGARAEHPTGVLRRVGLLRL